MKLINRIKKFLWTDEEIYHTAGILAERFHENGTAEYDYLKDKIYYNIRCGYYNYE
jgi:hypothetical protein